MPLPTGEGHRSAPRGNRRKLRNDMILIGGLLVALAMLALLMFLFAEEGDSVVVTVNGEHYAAYPLSEQR